MIITNRLSSVNNINAMVWLCELAKLQLIHDSLYMCKEQAEASQPTRDVSLPVFGADSHLHCMGLPTDVSYKVFLLVSLWLKLSD